MKVPICFVVLFGLLNATTCVVAQDTRQVTEPTFPATCAVYYAPLQSTSDGPTVGASATEQNNESKAESLALVNALKKCPAGEAVELALGADSSFNAFLIDPVAVPTGVSLIIDGGVTVYGSRDPKNYQDDNDKTNPGHVTCGTIGVFPAVRGCVPLLSFVSNSGVYGYGVIDGQGNRTLLSGAHAGEWTWWDLTIHKKGNDEQASVRVIGAGNGIAPADNFVLYKITIRNPPYHTMSWSGDGLTIWGVKIQAPWNLPNTDGFDLQGTNGTIYDTTVANGDQEVVFVAGNSTTGNMTVNQFHGYNKGGITILGSNPGTVSNLLIENAIITGDLPSVVGTTVNGVSEATLKNMYGIRSYTQALPNATNDLKALQITTNNNGQAKPEATIMNVTYKSVCIQDIVKPINLAPLEPFTSEENLPAVGGLTFQDVHILAPTSQFPALKRGLSTVPPGPGSYQVFLQAYPPEYINGLTFDNLVFDDLPGGDSSLGQITAEGNSIATQTNVYPSLLNDLTASSSVTKKVGNSELVLASNSYTSTTSTSSASLAHPCSLGQLPFTVGDLYVSNGSVPIAGSSTNLQELDMFAGGSITLNAVVQPIMTQTTLFIEKSYGADPGLVAVGSPALTNQVRFYEGSNLVGTASLAANGTLASLVLTDISEGTHVYTAQYPADAYYDTLNFGSVTVNAHPRPRPIYTGNSRKTPGPSRIEESLIR